MSMGEITSWGRRILQEVPSVGIGERTLIERVHGLGDYAGYTRMIGELVEAGYLLRVNGVVKKTKKGEQV